MRRFRALAAVPAAIAAASLFPAPSVPAPTEAAAPAPAAPRKRALLVAVNGYARPNTKLGWWDLNTKPDVDRIKQVLIAKFGFKPEEIRVLATKKETTRAGITGAFRAFLVEPTREGDVVFFHYSGHGAQTPDDEKGEEIDGLDETLVPSDYVSSRDGKNDIRDDEMGDLIDALKRKRPGSAFLTFDCCFSGTNTRGGRMLVRGRQWEGDRSLLPTVTRGAAGSGTGLTDGADLAGAGVVALSATRSDEVATETEDDQGKPMGALSYALMKALAQSAVGPTGAATYRDLFDVVMTLMARKAPGQTPQIEGTVDTVLLNGRALRPEPSILVDVRTGAGGKPYPVLRAGRLQGMTPGSRVALYPPGTKDFKSATPRATAELTQVEATTSVLKVVGAPAVPADQLRAARAIVTERRFPDNPLRVDAAALGDSPRKAAILEALGDLEKRSLATTAKAGASAATRGWDIRLRTPASGPPSVRGGEAAPDPKTILVERLNGTLVRSIPDGPRAPDLVREALEGEARRKLLTEIDNQPAAPEIRAEFRLVPVEVETDERGFVKQVLGDKPAAAAAGGAQVELPLGAHVALEVRNVGLFPAYVTILNLRADGTIGPVWPHPSVPTSNLLTIEASQQNAPQKRAWFRPKLPGGLPYVFVITEPLGQEMYKAIATREPADFSPLIDASTLQTRGAPAGGARGAREAQTPLGRLLMSATLGTRTRGQASFAAPAEDWATHTVYVNVIAAPTEPGMK